MSRIQRQHDWCQSNRTFIFRSWSTSHKTESCEPQIMRISHVVPLAAFSPLSLNAFVLVPKTKNVGFTALSVEQATGAVDGERFTIPLEQLSINDIPKVGGYEIRHELLNRNTIDYFLLRLCLMHQEICFAWRDDSTAQSPWGTSTRRFCRHFGRL
jgi:hypothetical protein